MKSICIKTNNSNILDYLLNELNNIDLCNVCFSINKFKHYKNIIVHYTGNEVNVFISKISSILSYLVIDELETDLFKKLIIRDFFYFDSNERNKILDICFDITIENFNDIFNEKFNNLFNSFYTFLSNNKNINLTGFINFRIKEYLDILNNILNEAVNHFIIEKEYLEFISLLKLYINTQNCNCDIIHIIYSNSEAILLDESKNIINLKTDSFNAKYLSDITFSSNDYALNSLLTLLPRKIYIHLVNGFNDEFIDTLKLIFENRITLCSDCNICKIYKTSYKTT